MGGTRARTPRGADARGLAERAHVKRKWLVGLTSVTSKRDLSSRRASEKPPHPLPRMSTRVFRAAACIWPNRRRAGLAAPSDSRSPRGWDRRVRQ